MLTDIKTLVTLTDRINLIQGGMNNAQRAEEVARLVKRLALHNLIRFGDGRDQVALISPPLIVQRGLFANAAVLEFYEKIEDAVKRNYATNFSFRCLTFRTTGSDTPYSRVQQALLRGDVARCEKLLERRTQGRNPYGWHDYVSPLVSQIIETPQDVTPEVFLYLFSDIAEHLICAGAPAARCTAILQAQLPKQNTLSDAEFLCICAWYTWTGSQDALIALREKTGYPIRLKAINACLALLKGEFEQADKAFGKVLTCTTATSYTSRIFNSGRETDKLFCEVDVCGNFFCLAFLASLRAKSSITRTERLNEKLTFVGYGYPYVDRMGVDFSRLNNLANNEDISDFEIDIPSTMFLSTFLCSLESLFLEEEQVPPSIRSESVSLLKTAYESGFGFIAASLVPCVLRLNPDDAQAAALCETVRREIHVAPLWGKSHIVKPWDRALDELEDILPKAGTGTLAPNATSDHFLKWILTVNAKDPENLMIHKMDARLLKRLKSGKWSTGLQLRLDKLVCGDYDDKLDASDMGVKEALRAVGGSALYYGMFCDYSEAQKLLPALVGNPRVYVDVSSSSKTGEVGPVAFVKGEVSLEVKTAANGDTVIQIPWKIGGMSKTVQLVRERDDQFVVYKRTPLQMKLAEIVARYGQNGKLVIPAESAARFQTLLPSLAREIGVKGDFDTEAVDARLIDGGVQLLLRGRLTNGVLLLELLNRPVETLPLFVTPGSGMRKTLTRQDDEMVAVCRNLDAERQALADFLAACPSLSEWATAETRWEIENLANILTTLDECHALAERIPLEWPERDGLDVVRPRSTSPFSLAGKSGTDFWLEIGGDVALDDGRVMTFGDLLAAIGNRTEGFVRLSETRYLHLTKKLAAELELLSKAGELSSEGLRLPPCALPVLESISNESRGLDFPALVSTRIDEFRNALKQDFSPPPSLTCELRPYQRDGFSWLAKLAACGLGACLSDDMGLGKTVQMLALLTHLGARGPSLVVAPTSVSRNWQEEAARFAPALNFTLLTDAEDRAALVRDAGPFDVIVCSYGLLLFEEELLSGREWNVGVLDEAQAVKNRLAKRARVVKRLRCAMRAISTGTPVENNLGELWSLFDFLNPGLLGTHGQFERRYCNSDGSVSALLKKMTAPFILRRLKSEVLDDLPPKTEISLEVVLDDEERALYESCRRDALASLEGGGEEANPIAMLAHLTRLRRVCCHPSLVLPDCTLAGQKVEAFMELVADLKAGGHRALVFSQFVDFLSIIRTRLDRESIAYQYLDGSMPLKQRTEAVARFQRGEGDLFLISLKAGGTGLNLTAANYVILLDPWWNPAVEMQAADRAHRIGQKNPVTIYRLITANTVEARVVELHAHKRALADAILEDTGNTRLSAADLTNLFKG